MTTVIFLIVRVVAWLLEQAKPRAIIGDLREETESDFFSSHLSPGERFRLWHHTKEYYADFQIVSVDGGELTTKHIIKGTDRPNGPKITFTEAQVATAILDGRFETIEE